MKPKLPYLFAITQVKFLLEIHKYILYTYYTYRFLFGGKRIRLSPRVFVRELSRIDFKQGRYGIFVCIKMENKC